ncbi:unnamed protein product, partial [Rotaria sp. Silwood2]
CVIRLSSAH